MTFVWWLSFPFLKTRFCVEGSYFWQWRWRFLKTIIIAQSTQNSFVFYNCIRSFGFNPKYRMVSWKWRSVEKESILRKLFLTEQHIYLWSIRKVNKFSICRMNHAKSHAHLCTGLHFLGMLSFACLKWTWPLKVSALTSSRTANVP